MATENFSKLEQIVSELYGPNCKPETKEFCNSIENFYLSNPSKFQELFQCLSKTEVPFFKFWLMDVLRSLIEKKYNSMTVETKNNFRKSLLEIFASNNSQNIFKESYLINRFGLLFNNFIFFDFPENNNTIFNDMLNNIYNTADLNQKLTKLNLLLQIFNSFNDEFIQSRHTYTDIQITRSNIIKDFLRINTIQNLLIVIKQILENEEYIKNEEIVKKSLVIISQLIDWVPIEFFIDVLKIMINNLIKKYKYFKECVDILRSTVKKGMEPKDKRNILDGMNINVLLNNIITHSKKIDNSTLQKIADVVNLIGNFIVENFEYTKLLINQNNSSGNDEIMNSFNWSCNELRYYFYFIKEICLYNKNINYEEMLTLCDSLEQVVNYLKSNDIILQKNDYVMQAFKEIFKLMEKIIKIPESEYSLDEDLSQCYDEPFFGLRKEIADIYRKIYNINAVRDFVINSVLENLYNILKINSNINIENINKYDIEFCLYLIDIIQMAFHSNDLKNNEYNKEGKLNKIINILFTFPFTKIKNADFIVWNYYETLNKGLNNFIMDQHIIENLIKLYLSEQGVFYDGKISTNVKIIGNFDKFLSKIKRNLSKNKINIDNLNISNIIRDSINKIIISIKTSKNFELLKNFSVLFHAFGVMISIEENLNNKKNAYSEGLKLFINMINEFNVFEKVNSGKNQELFGLIIDCLIQFVQAAGNQIKNDVLKELFINFFNVFISEYCIKIVNNKNINLLMKYIYLMQRILILLGKESLPYLEYFFNNYSNNTNIISENLKLIQNSVNLLKKDSKSLVKKTFNTPYKYILNLAIPKDNISEENKIIFGIFIDFIKTFNCICLEIPEVFFENGGIDGLPFVDLIKYVLNVGSKLTESLQRRTSIKSINNIVKYFNTNKNLFENQNFFKDLVFNILDGLFIIYSKREKNNIIDNSSAVELAQCNVYLSVFNNIYMEYLMKYLNQVEINQFVDTIKKIDLKKLKPSEELLNAFDYFSMKVMKKG